MLTSSPDYHKILYVEIRHLLCQKLAGQDSQLVVEKGMEWTEFERWPWRSTQLSTAGLFLTLDMAVKLGENNA